MVSWHGGLTLAHGILFLLSSQYSVVMFWVWPGTSVTWDAPYEMDTEHFANPWLIFCKMLVFRVCCVTQNFYMFNLYHNPDLDHQIFYCYQHQWLPCRLRMWVPFSCLWVIWMAIIRRGFVLQPRINMVLQPLALQLCLVVISWLSAWPIHVVEHLTFWWLMFLT